MCALYITDCPPFQLPNGKFRYLNTSVFLYVTGIVCNYGYQLNGRGINHCENGQWKYTQSCDSKCIINQYNKHYSFFYLVKQCPIPEDIPIGTVRYRNPPVHGSLAVYSCPRPYVVSGFQRRLCNNGKWEGYPPKCKIISKYHITNFIMLSIMYSAFEPAEYMFPASRISTAISPYRTNFLSKTISFTICIEYRNQFHVCKM